MSEQQTKIEIDITDRVIDENRLRNFAEMVVNATDQEERTEAFQRAINEGVNPYLVGGMAEEIRDERAGRVFEKEVLANERARLDVIIDQATSDIGSKPSGGGDRVWFRNTFMSRADAIKAREDDPAGR